VSFLIADLSGRALVRLTHVALGDEPRRGDRHDDEERATVLPFDGGPRSRRCAAAVQVPAPEGPVLDVLRPSPSGARRSGCSSWTAG
jgi:hypothetical protein